MEPSLAEHAALRWQRWVRSRERLATAVGIGGLLVGLTAGTLWWRAEQQAQHQQQALQHYLNGLWAAEVARWDVAAREFEAAGPFRDAPQRHDEAARQLDQVEQRYHSALQALDEGRIWEAAAALQLVVAELPEYGEAEALLEGARQRLGALLLFRQVPGERTTVVLASPERGQERQLATDVAQGSAAAFSPDGAWLTYEVLDGGRSSLWLVETAGEQQWLLADGVLDAWARWSPDGHTLLYGWQGEEGWSLFTREAGAERARRLVRGADLASADFSPAGHWLTLWLRQGNAWSLWLAEARGEATATRLAEGSEGLGLLSWAADESRLGYTLLRDGRWTLSVQPPSGGAAELVAADSERAWLRFRPDSADFVLWRSDAQGGRLLLQHGAEQAELLRGAADGWARWSPDGRWLAVAEWNGRTWLLRLWPVGEAGLGAAQTLAREVVDLEFSFAPTGRALLYRTWQEERWQLTVRALPSGEEKLLLGAVHQAQSAWLADGEHLLLWWVQEPTAGGSLALANGATGRRLTLQEGLRGAQGGSSRDGSRLAFTTQALDGSHRAWTANPDGSDLLELDRFVYRVTWARGAWEFGLLGGALAP